MAVASGAPVEDEESRRAAFGRRFLSDQVGRQRVVERTALRRPVARPPEQRLQDVDAWYHIREGAPGGGASSDGRPERYVAPREDAERERLWKLATKLYSGYEDYQARATNRRIPVIVLEPAQR